MSDQEESFWPITVSLIIIASGFTFGGPLIGLIVLIVTLVILGWSRRHDGPFPTDRD